MEIPIQVAVRVYPDTQIDESFIEIIPPNKNETENESSTSGIVRVEERTFPVSHALSIGITQEQIYLETVYPLLQSFMDGFDVSIVTYGQTKSGKSYTLFGPGFDGVCGESEHEGM